MNTSSLLLFINGGLVFIGLALLFLAYKVFIKKSRYAKCVATGKCQHFLKDALYGTLFFFTGCLFVACTLTEVPDYLYKRINSQKSKNSKPVRIHTAPTGVAND